MDGLRTGAYLHKDGLKGGALISVGTLTDFAARTDLVKNFVQSLAKFAYANQSEDIEELLEMFPDIKHDLEALSKELGEEVTILEIKIIT